MSSSRHHAPSQRQTENPPSLLDRLLDDTPDVSHEARSPYLDLGEYKRSLARDLEALLNTRIAANEAQFELHPHAAKSILQFGVPDLSGLSLLNPEDQTLIRDYLRRAIERHEPRLGRIRVQIEVAQELERQLRFRVEAVLKTHPQRPQVSFDALFTPSSSVYRVQG